MDVKKRYDFMKFNALGIQLYFGTYSKTFRIFFEYLLDDFVFLDRGLI